MIKYAMWEACSRLRPECVKTCTVYHSYTGPHDIDNPFKVMGSKVKVTDKVLIDRSLSSCIMRRTILASRKGGR